MNAGTGRPRIRTLKPEGWQDERISGLARDARLLFVVLITMADDEGRLRAAPSMILGHGFPYDTDAPRKLPKWLAELERTGLILRYQDDGKPYIAFRHWRRHQRVNRPNASLLPAPPDQRVVTENSVNGHDSLSDSSMNGHDSVTDDVNPHAQARVPIRSLSEETDHDTSRAIRFNRKLVPPDRLALAVAILADFNGQALTTFPAYHGDGTATDSLSRIIGALTHWPEKLTSDYCRSLVGATLRRRWWGNAPATVGVVFGPKVIEQNMALVDAAGGAARQTNAAAALAKVQQEVAR